MDFLRHPAWLWVHTYRKEMIPPVDAATQAMFDAGHEFEQYAEVQFPDGVTIGFTDYHEYTSLVDRTKQALANGTAVLFQPGFEWSNFTCISDIVVVHKDNEIDLYEIKSSTKVKPDHVYDLAFQTALIEKNGYTVKTVSVIHVNNTYTRAGDITTGELTSVVDVTDDVRDLVPATVEKYMPAAVKSVASRKTPNLDLSLARLGSKPNWKKIYDNFYPPEVIDYPSDLKPDIDKTKIRQFLNELEYPLYFFDYETMQRLVPHFDGHKPYQQIPFQYSLHVIREPDGEIEHMEYLHTENTNPAPEVAAQLVKDIGQDGSIIAWNMSFEKSINKALGEMLPEYCKQMEAINSRIVDLMTPFKAKWYKDLRFEGSASIKKVLPVLVPELSYDDLGVQEGNAAQRIWMEAILDGKHDASRSIILNDLREYCKLDTLAMVKIFEVLKSEVNTE